MSRTSEVTDRAAAGTALGLGAAGSVPHDLPGNAPDHHGGASGSTSGVTFVAIPSAIALVIVTPLLETLLVALVGPVTGSGTGDAAGNGPGDDPGASCIATILAPVLPGITAIAIPPGLRNCGAQERGQRQGNQEQPRHFCITWTRVIVPSGLCVLQSSTRRTTSLDIHSRVSAGAAAPLVPTR